MIGLERLRTQVPFANIFESLLLISQFPYLLGISGEIVEDMRQGRRCRITDFNQSARYTVGD